MTSAYTIHVFIFVSLFCFSSAVSGDFRLPVTESKKCRIVRKKPFIPGYVLVADLSLSGDAYSIHNSAVMIQDVKLIFLSSLL